jgi:hypothetical protein
MEEHSGREIDPRENNKVKLEPPEREFDPQEKDKGK